MYRLLVGLLVLGMTVGCAGNDNKPKNADKDAEKPKARPGPGDPMPELTGKNLQDKEVKLSDLRGKVVVVDVWATWCGPCKAMIPHERELVERLKGKPFALVSISVDAKKETLTDFLEQEKMPWMHWWDGQAGPIGKTLKIEGYPTVFVLDGKGVIRFKSLGWREARAKEMDTAIDKALKEIEDSKKES